MPNKLPTPGQDSGNWGTMLNGFLTQSLDNSNGGGINKFEQFSQRPNNLTTEDKGKTYLYTQTGNFHQWTGTEWKVLNESVINVKDYGAVGDGVADDTTAIQIAITGKNQKTILFPSGIYKVTSTVTIVGTLRLLGEGQEITHIQNHANILFDIDGYGFVIDGVSFENKKAASVVNNVTFPIGLKLTGRIFTLYNISFSGVWAQCIHLTNVFDSRFENINILNDLVNNDVANKTGIGFNIYYSVNNTITNSYLGHADTLIKLDPAYSPGNYRCEGWIITNTILISSKTCIFADGITHISVSDCVFDFVYTSAIVLTNVGFSASISNNWFAGSTSTFTAISLSDKFSSSSIVGNQILSTSPGATAFIVNGKYNFVSGNRIKDINSGTIYGGNSKFVYNILENAADFTNSGADNVFI